MKKFRTINLIFLVISTLTEIIALALFFGKILPSSKTESFAKLISGVSLPIYLALTALIFIFFIVILTSTIMLFKKFDTKHFSKSFYDYIFLIQPGIFVLQNLLLLLFL